MGQDLQSAFPRVCGKVYEAMVQSVLLFGSETWNLTPTLAKRLEGFNTRAASLVVAKNKPRQELDGTWTYPPTVDVLEEIGLFPIAHYVQVRQNTIAGFIVYRPTFEFYEKGRTKCRSRPRQF